ncbi:hypothetical protein K1T71_010180 [Dendrolimus kikuchii]|uniref:Uncharacterized protein n=1 Tax=Dendrolimus kikuchii TaxID=765133 RepID=A0ACC1CQW1_9NEOP|nr:hypothetical protein K1T71_010180 [Dendrolimus kikuchii]
MLAGEEASIELVQRWLQRRESDDVETGSSSGSPGARAGRRSSLALTPEDEPLVDVANQTAIQNGRPEKVLGCWARFKSLFEDRGFDLTYEYTEYNNPRQISIIGENHTNNEGYRRTDGRKSFDKRATTNRNAIERTNSERTISDSSDSADGELAGVINFYEQFATLNEENKEENNDIWRRSSGVRNRVSIRPSVLLTKIAEEPSAEGEDEIELNRSPPPAHIPSALLYAPPEPLELLCVFPERTSRVCAAACGATARAGGEARSVRCARETLEALRRDNDARLPHVIVVDARQSQVLDAPLLARAIRGTKNTQHIILIAVVKKSAYLKDDFGVLPYLEAGFNRNVSSQPRGFCTSLYSPQMRDDPKLRVEDPIATDLIGALLSREQVNTNLFFMQGPTNMLSSRRSSNDSTVVRSQTNRTNIKHKTSGQLRELLDTALNWDFEIFRLEDLTRGRPLAHLGLALMGGRFDVCAALECDERTLLHWLTVVETNYHAVNTYHNSTHAADVLQAVAYFLEKDRLKSVLEPLEAAAALLAAAAHDIDHPGTSSAFLCNARHPLAILYNDVSVLESHHAALTFKLTLNDDRVNIFKNLDRETYKSVRHNVIDMILATEMTKHFEHLAKFVNVFYAKSSGSKEDGMHNDEPLALDTTALSQPENVILIKRMMIKCADVSNASRPQKFAFEWARRIAEEYFLQTDEEKAKDLPVVMPMFDRATCSIPRSQIGFIDYIIIDMMEAWAAFIDMPELVSHARNNHLRWKELDEAGVTTLADVKRAQRQTAIQAPPTSTTQPTHEE